MFDITCATCRQRYLVGSRSIRALRNTDQGPVAVVRCPAGHLLEHEFRHPGHRATVVPGEEPGPGGEPRAPTRVGPAVATTASGAA